MTDAMRIEPRYTMGRKQVARDCADLPYSWRDAKYGVNDEIGPINAWLYNVGDDSPAMIMIGAMCKAKR